jgi:hypothetical protein
MEGGGWMPRRGLQYKAALSVAYREGRALGQQIGAVGVPAPISERYREIAALHNLLQSRFLAP